MRKPRIANVMPIAELLWPEFAVVKGCVFLKRFVPAREDIRFPSRTEWDENHVHLLDYFTHGAKVRSEPFFNSHHPDFLAAEALGRKVCFMWAHKLRQDFPRWHFRVYFHGFEPTVRFHRVRAREAPEIGDQDRKEEIKTGELVIVDTRKLKS
jgi:hypothetical protein